MTNKKFQSEEENVSSKSIMSDAFLTKHFVTRPGEEAEAYKFLSSLGTFSELPDHQLKDLAPMCRFAEIPSGQYITSEGDPECPSGFIVESGRLSMIKTSLSGKELVVELLAPGDIFGFVELLSAQALPLQLSSRAQIKSRVLWVPVKTLSNLLDAHPMTYRGLVDQLLRRLQLSYGISRGLAHDRVEVRIASILTTLTHKFSRRLPGTQNQTIDITRQQIADLTGTTPETAIRVTRAMQEEGLIDLKKSGVVRVLDLHGLQDLADG